MTTLPLFHESGDVVCQQRIIAWAAENWSMLKRVQRLAVSLTIYQKLLHVIPVQPDGCQKSISRRDVLTLAITSRNILSSLLLTAISQSECW